MLTGRRDLRLVLSAGFISLTGDWILMIGLIYRVYAVTGSTVASALTIASSFAPQVLLGAVAGVFADRWDRKRTMITADLLLAAGLLPLLLVRGAAQVWIVFAVMFWEGSVQQFFSPAEQAMVPRLVPDDELVTANAVNGQVSNVSRLAGSALGGILAATGGIVAVTLIDAASFLASAALLALVRTSGRTASRGSGPVRARLAQVGAELRDGLRLATRHRVLRALMIFALVTSVGEGIMSTLFTPFVEHVLHGTPQDLGLIVAAQAVGGIAGGMVAAAYGAPDAGGPPAELRRGRLRPSRPGHLPLPSRLRRCLARRGGDDRRRPAGGADPGRADDAVPAQQRGLLPGPGLRRGQCPGRRHRAGRHAGRGLSEPVRGYRPGAGHPGRGGTWWQGWPCSSGSGPSRPDQEATTVPPKLPVPPRPPATANWRWSWRTRASVAHRTVRGPGESAGSLAWRLAITGVGTIGRGR